MLTEGNVKESFPTQVQFCFFCFRDSKEVTLLGANSEVNPERPLMHKFLLSFQRYLGDINVNGQCVNNLTTLFSNGFDGEIKKWLKGLGPCEDCSFLLGDFCAIYDQFKCLELKLNWRLENLLEIMKCSGNVPARVKSFPNYVILSEQEKDEALTKIRKCRNALSEMCSSKLKSTFPKILLKKCHLSSSSAQESKLVSHKRKKNERGNLNTSEKKSEIVELNESESLTNSKSHAEGEVPCVELSFTSKCKATPSKEGNNFRNNVVANSCRKTASDQLECNSGDNDLLENHVDDDDRKLCPLSNTFSKKQNDNRSKPQSRQCVDASVPPTMPVKSMETCKSVKLKGKEEQVLGPREVKRDVDENVSAIIVSENELHTKSISVKPPNLVDEDPSIEISSVFPVHVKEPPFEYAEEYRRNTGCSDQPVHTSVSSHVSSVKTELRSRNPPINSAPKPGISIQATDLKTTSKRHICLQCNKELTRAYDLKNHMLIHKGIKNFHCGICKKSFTKKQQLKLHESVHSAARPFKCKRCGKLFRTQNNLSQHKETHNDYMAFECQHCGKKFKHCSTLSRHKRKSHAKESCTSN